jgi:hypothetical protein
MPGPHNFVHNTVIILAGQPKSSGPPALTKYIRAAGASKKVF